jgi:hypothetical protein
VQKGGFCSKLPYDSKYQLIQEMIAEIKQSGYSNTLYINCLPYQKSVLKAFSGTRIVIGQVRYSKLG